MNEVKQALDALLDALNKEDKSSCICEWCGYDTSKSKNKSIKQYRLRRYDKEGFCNICSMCVKAAARKQFKTHNVPNPGWIVSDCPDLLDFTNEPWSFPELISERIQKRIEGYPSQKNTITQFSKRATA